MPPFSILWPTFALVALIFVVLIWLAVARSGHMRRHPPREADFASGEAAGRYFQPVEMPANNLRNLFEVPVLYFALVPLLILTRQADHLQVLLAWLFVILRWLHSFAHVVIRKVTLRAPFFWVSVLVLLAMWIGFFVDLAAAAHRYDAVMANLTM